MAVQATGTGWSLRRLRERVLPGLKQDFAGMGRQPILRDQAESTCRTWCTSTASAAAIASAS